MITMPSQSFPRVPLKQMDPAMLVFELDRESARVMQHRGCELITSAATMASFLHRNQTRMVRGDLPKVPYIEHPLRVALRLIRWGIDNEELIAAALLHDIVEDCSAELLEHFGRPEDHDDANACLARLYGCAVADLVRRVTNPTDGSTYQEHLEELAGSSSIALLIKASDLKDNAGSIQHQLGHGKDRCLLKMLRKYLPSVAVIRHGLNERVIQQKLVNGRAVIRAAAELWHLERVLNELAHEYAVELDG